VRSELLLAVVFEPYEAVPVRVVEIGKEASQGDVPIPVL
jgi:hypothetical protein